MVLASGFAAARPRGHRCPPYERQGVVVTPPSAGICQDQVGPGSNRFMRLKYVGLEKAPNKTLFLALHPDNRASVIGADQKIGEN